MNKINVLVVAAHPDDEILGCGGTIALHADAGDRVTVAIACEGESLRYGEGGVGQHDHITCAGNILGVSETRLFKFPDQRLDTKSLVEIILPIENLVREKKPNIVYSQFGGDSNRDHQLLFQAVLIATRPTEEYLQAIYAFDTASSTEWGYPRTFIPDTWIDVSSVLDRKLEAFSCYESEVRVYPHPRSIQALEYRAKAWGNRCCLEAAEVFMTVRRVIRGL